MKEKIKQLRNLKKQIVQDVFDSDLSKVEKLKIFSEQDLLGTSPYIVHIFEDKYRDEIPEEPPGYKLMTDDYFSDGEKYDRGVIIDFYENIESILEEVEYYKRSLDEKIEVITARNGNWKKEISIQQFIDDIYDFVLEHKVIKFYFDW